MIKNKPFSLRARGKSFKHAIDGIRSFFSSEHNAIVHLAGTIVVTVLGVLVHVSGPETILLVLAAGFVWTAELFNTAIEKIMDFISPKQHPAIGIIKDISAAAVLVAAIVAFITGCIVFIPKL